MDRFQSEDDRLGSARANGARRKELTRVKIHHHSHKEVRGDQTRKGKEKGEEENVRKCKELSLP